MRTHEETVRLPESKRGRRSKAQQAHYDAQIDAFIGRLLEIRSRLDFKIGTRGWCYQCEDAGMIGKGDFKRLEGLIGDWRKSGRLPLDFCANDDKRAPVNLEDLDEDNPADYAESYISVAATSWRRYEPFSLWDFQRCYIEMAVEKSDLRTLFENVCAEYHVPVWNAGGWSDINSRADLMKRFQEHSEAGRHCVLLYCGDHDPAGLFISDVIRKNLRDLEKAVGWSPDEDQLTIERFGLNYDFIRTNSLLWIEGLETGSGEKLEDPKHPDHFKPYVQTYLKKYGARKVEANALVVRPAAGRQLARDAIEDYIDQEGVDRYWAELNEKRLEVREALPDLMRKSLDEQGGQGTPP